MIEVGDKIPIATNQTSVGNNVTSSTQFENATIKLTLTPYIRPDSDVVRLKLEQIIRQLSNVVIKAKNLADSTQAVSDRSLKTNIVVNSGDTAVLGGLMRDQEDLEETKIPILGDIPVLGWLFKSKTATKKKVNLVIFITPKIIRGVKDSQKLLSDKANERIDWVKRNFDGRDPYGKTMDRLPRASKAEDADRPTKTNSDEPVNIKR